MNWKKIVGCTLNFVYKLILFVVGFKVIASPKSEFRIKLKCDREEYVDIAREKVWCSS